MSNILDHVAYLSDEIGPRPSGTEEEQTSALYITDRLQKDAHLAVNIEDFAASTDTTLAELICFAAVIVVAVLGMAIRVLLIPAAVLAVAAAALYAAELFDRPILSPLFNKGVSQNVVARYNPPRNPEAGGARRRKVIIVANYDSGRVRPEYNRALVPAMRYIQTAAAACMGLVPLLLVIRAIFLRGLEGTGATVLNVIMGIMLVIIALPTLQRALGRIAPYNDGANSNASGVAVMLEIARRIGNGLVATEPIDDGMAVHDEETLREEGLIPEGAEVNYEGVKPVNGLAAAKAAIAAMTGQPVSDYEVTDVSGNLVQARGVPVPEVQEEAEPNPEFDKNINAFAQADGTNEPVAAEGEAAATTAAPAPVAAEPVDSSVPEWYRKATAKARKDDAPIDESLRSRYAATPVEPEPEPEPAPAAESAEPAVVRFEAEVEPEPVEEPEAAAEESAPESAEAAEPQVEAAEAPAAEEQPVEEPGAAAEPLDADKTVGMPPIDEPEAAAEPLDADKTVGMPPIEEPQVDPLAKTAPLDGRPRMTPERASELEQRAQKNRVSVSFEDVDTASRAGATQLMSPLNAANAARNQGRPFDLPSISLPEADIIEPLSFDDLRQRAPLASMADGGKAQPVEPTAPAQPQQAAPAAPAVTEAPRPSVKPQSAAATVALNPINDAAFQRASADFLTDDDDLVIDDADDTLFGLDETESATPAGSRVDMPKSRIGRLFDKFRRKDGSDGESAADWLGVDDDFDAREAGKERGGWESFRKDDDDTWQGGAFSSLRARVSDAVSSRNQVLYDEGEDTYEPEVAADDEIAYEEEAAPEVVHDDPEYTTVSYDATPEEEIRQIYSFAAGGINTEVWFVALGSQVGSNQGMKAFLSAHAAEMRGAVIVNLEALGAGETCYIEREGSIIQGAPSARMKRYVKRAGQDVGLHVNGAKIDWRDSAASYALRRNLQAISIVGMDGAKPAGFAEAGDTVETVDEQLLEMNADLVIELLKNI